MCCKHFQAYAQFALRTHAHAPQASTCSAGRPPHRVQVPSIAENWQTQPAHLALADALGNGPYAVATMIRACLYCCCCQLGLPGMCSTMRSVRMHMHCMPATPWQAQPTYLALAKPLIGRLTVTSICLHVYRIVAAASSWRQPQSHLGLQTLQNQLAGMDAVGVGHHLHREARLGAQRKPRHILGGWAFKRSPDYWSNVLWRGRRRPSSCLALRRCRTSRCTCRWPGCSRPGWPSAQSAPSA